MTQPRDDRIIPLQVLNSYPGADTLDVTLWLPKSEETVRHVWAMVPHSTPTVSIDDTKLEPRRISEAAFRWVDYGVAELPTGFTQLRIRGLDTSECEDSYLLIAFDTDFSPEGLSLDDAERKLWGLARADAGNTSLRPSRLATGSPTTFAARYTAGPNGLPAGAMVRFTVPKAFAFPQADDPGGDGYAAIGQADCEVSVETVEPSVESHEKTDIICRLEDRLAPREGFELHYRTDWTYIFSNEFHLVDRMYWYSKVPPLSAAVAVTEGSPFVSLADGNGHSFEMAPGPAERLHLFLPGRRRESETVTLRGTYTDRYRNSPPSGLIDAELELSLVGESGETPLGTPAVRFVARHRFEIPLPDLAPGVYRAVARRPGSDAIIARSNPLEVLASEDGRGCIYWGEIHGHSEMSDGCGDYAERYRHARDEGCLDFAAAADHACYFSDNEWLWMQDVTNSWDEPGRFTTLNGYEWAGKQAHRNVYTSRDRLDLFRGMYPPTSNIDVAWEHFHGDEEVVGGPHGPLAHGITWEFHDPSVERFVEIYSMWGAGDFRENPLVPEFARNNRRGMTASELLGTGAKLGFTGGGDCHEGRVGFSAEDPDGQGTTPHTFAAVLLYRCGMTAAVMPALDRPSLVRALRERTTYATTGAQVLLDFAVSGTDMGSIGEAERADCRASIHATEPIRRIDIIKDGEVAYSREFDGELDTTINWQDPEVPTGEHFYYLHVVQNDHQMAWSSPVWVKK